MGRVRFRENSVHIFGIVISKWQLHNNGVMHLWFVNYLNYNEMYI
jgi:hypothetical protein